MNELIRQVCALSILCGVCLSLSPEGSAKRMLRFVSAVALFACLAFGITSMDWDVYAIQTALVREREAQILQQGEDARKALERRVIESECNTYIWDRAASLGIKLDDVSVSVQWSTEGVWIPYSVKLWLTDRDQARQALGAAIEADLGIPAERQEWIGYGE